MSTGISMSSVNKIKELADNGDYSLALDILEHQDLSKSLSPQFIRICGEVYYENGRYSEAREALVRAHSMAPAGNKIIYSLIKLYLSMGLRELAEHYFEIYRFNQENKDAGTYRIEYMIAKAHHKPVNELYSILVSANDIDTSEEWDYEMLLLHAYIRNISKFDSAAVEFRAKYRNSARLSTLENLISDECDLESMIYVFPCIEKADDAPEQDEVRSFEKKILAEDDLKIHPKDAKIMIMVEDDAPVTSSMKLKQMWIRSKDKKEHKKELRREESEDDKRDKKKSRNFFGIMSKKEEELVDKEMEEIQSEEFDKEKLLNEVVSDSNAHEEKGSDDISNVESETTESVQDMTEISQANMTDEESAGYSAETEDSFVIEEEPEDVVMVDSDIMDIVAAETAGESSKDIGDDVSDAGEEVFDPEFEEDDDAFAAEEDANENREQVSDDTFDFDKAFESLEEFDIEEENFEMEDHEIIDIEPEPADSETIDPEPVVDENPDIETIDIENIEIDKADSEVEEPEFPDSEPEEAKLQDFESEEMELTDSESEGTKTTDLEPEETETTDSEPEETETTDPEPEETETTDSEPEETETTDSEPEEMELADSESEEVGAEALGDIDNLDVEEEPIYRKYQPDNSKYADFPIFKSSLFPDYNTDGAKMYDLGDRKVYQTDAEEIKISENLQKEEDLIGETDRLLARLGIKFETEFKSILNNDETENADVDNKDDSETVSCVEKDAETVSLNNDTEQEQDDIKKTEKRPFNERKDKTKKERKSFKLKG